MEVDLLRVIMDGRIHPEGRLVVHQEACERMRLDSKSCEVIRDLRVFISYQCFVNDGSKVGIDDYDYKGEGFVGRMKDPDHQTSGYICTVTALNKFYAATTHQCAKSGSSSATKQAQASVLCKHNYSATAPLSDYIPYTTNYDKENRKDDFAILKNQKPVWDGCSNFTGINLCSDNKQGQTNIHTHPHTYTNSYTHNTHTPRVEYFRPKRCRLFDPEH
ncbi:uncharacterized protein LOC142348060 [Convolutriloba macropyga]|uniref:uncharacterized protein LOC142348060 n=1 Tax=Convolutriloba macropyga TaxID=536237 RepID=UPI003F5266D1